MQKLKFPLPEQFPKCSLVKHGSYWLEPISVVSAAVLLNSAMAPEVMTVVILVVMVCVSVTVILVTLVKYQRTLITKWWPDPTDLKPVILYPTNPGRSLNCTTKLFSTRILNWTTNRLNSLDPGLQVWPHLFELIVVVIPVMTELPLSHFPVTLLKILSSSHLHSLVLFSPSLMQTLNAGHVRFAHGTEM